MGLNRVLQQRSTAKVVLSLAKYSIAELLEEAVQLLLLER